MEIHSYLDVTDLALTDFGITDNLKVPRYGTGYQILSDEKIVAEVVGTKESSNSDEEDDMPVTLPKGSEVRSCIDTATVCGTHQE